MKAWHEFARDVWESSKMLLTSGTVGGLLVIASSFAGIPLTGWLGVLILFVVFWVAAHRAWLKQYEAREKEVTENAAMRRQMDRDHREAMAGAQERHDFLQEEYDYLKDRVRDLEERLGIKRPPEGVP